MFTALIDVMELFSFKDGDELIREGAKDGTHFFIASEGTFDVVVKGDVRAQIHSGMGFGESVFLESGVRRATVRAKGRAQAFGMRGHMVRKVLKRRHWQKHGEVVAPISEILSSDDCVLLRRLTPFQVQKLYDVALLRHLKDGELLYSGTTHDNDVYVVLSGALILPREGAPRRIERFGVVGVMSAILGCRAGAGKLYSEGASELLLLTRSLLVSMFEAQWQAPLFRARTIMALRQVGIFSHLYVEEVDAVAAP